MKRTPLEESSGAEAVKMGSAGILRILGETLRLHGPDPLSEPIIAAAIVMAIRRMEETLGLIHLRRIVHKMTGEKKP